VHRGSNSTADPSAPCPFRLVVQYAARVAAGRSSATTPRSDCRQAARLERRLAEHRLARKFVLARLAVRPRAAAAESIRDCTFMATSSRHIPMLKDLSSMRRRSRAKRRVHSTNSWPTCTSASTRCARRPIGRDQQRGSDPDGRPAAIAQETWLLASNEFQSRHRRRMMSRPAVQALVQVGSWWSRPRTLPPDELYKDGLNRALFLRSSR